ncbi:unnamed protein product [Timema podura]|uniref:Uncharacterized protein n=1 Tax=Timema podura TaxID=61482 RepID=A0ABN7NQ39_TIMPD|nr:unnamed protein product [Timema podura]
MEKQIPFIPSSSHPLVTERALVQDKLESAQGFHSSMQELEMVLCSHDDSHSSSSRDHSHVSLRRRSACWRGVIEGEIFLDRQCWQELVRKHPPGQMEGFHDDDDTYGNHIKK